jgi:hypothetical protein
VSVGEKGVQVENGSTSGEDGVAIHTGLATNWTAATFIETEEPESKTVLSSVSEGSTTSTATIEQREESIAYSSTFTGAGDETTYSMLVYNRGVLQAAVGGVRSGGGGVINTRPNPGWTPYCRPIGQSYSRCLNSCRSAGYISCNYCSRPCRNTFNTSPLGACQWRFDLAYPAVSLPDGRVVRADEVVMTEEVHGPTNYPYLGFDQIQLQTTAKATTVTNESVVNACTSAK